MFKEKLKKLKD